ncbi:MAG TPA: non-heme iron oxygenase ferredoxin subunit [Porticoccus sp.]|nr:non-heme iron oxygenase ferredoxin subunit [Porticoccus sp.]
MAEWTNVISANDLQEGMHTVVDLGDVSLLLVNIGGEFYAIENICSHDGGELSDGEIAGSEIICPRHGSHFCLKTGKVLSAPAFEDIDSYPVRIVDEIVQVFDEQK